jgi:hypothetical protein
MRDHPDHGFDEGDAQARGRIRREPGDSPGRAVMDGLLGGDPRRAGLRALPFPARLLLTLFLCGVAAGLAAGEGNVVASHAGADGRPGLSLEDLRRVYCGRPGWTLIASKVDGGSMEKHVPVPSERRAILDWARGGASREGFDGARKVLDLRCVRCHAPGGEKEESPFAEAREAGARHDLVARYAEPDRGMSLAARATTTHAHLFSLSVLLGLLGLVFLFTNTRPGVKAAVVGAAFGGMFLDVGCWWLTLHSPIFLAGIVAGGAILGCGILVLVIRPLWEMWGPEAKGLRV